MTEYHKIDSLFLRDMHAPGKPLIVGQWAEPEFEYLANNRWEFTEKVDGTNAQIALIDITSAPVRRSADTDTIPANAPIAERT